MSSSAIRSFARSVLRPTFALLATALSLACSEALAMWAYVPQEVRMLEADLVVAGRIARLGPSVRENNREYEVGILEPRQILRGKRPETIRISWPKLVPGAPRVSTEPTRFQDGQQGVWVLRQDGPDKTFRASYPTDYQPISRLPECVAKAKAVQAISWKKTDDGVEWGLFVESHDLRGSRVVVNGKPINAVARLTVFPLVKNLGDEPVHVANYLPDEPFELAVKGPDGKRIEVTLYHNRPGAPKPPLNRYNFVEIPAGKVRSIPYGFAVPNLTEAGKYTVAYRYANQRDGKALEIKNTWRGRVTSEAVEVNSR